MTGSVRVGVDLRPFRTWMLAPERLRDLADRHATPWDYTDGRPDARRAAHVLDEWKQRRVLVHQPQPAMYAYEQTGPKGAQRGLISAVHLDSRLLPHEDVIPSRAEDMSKFMRASGMNFPPIMLGYSGDGRTRAHLDTAAQQEPLVQLFTPDGQEHRVWRIRGRQAYVDITDELRTRAAFIADGQHRHSAARQYRRQLYAAGHGPGLWDYIPSFLVDTRHSPLRLGPLHRVLPYVEPRNLLDSAARGFRVTTLSGPLEEWIDVLRAHAYQGPAFVLATRQEAFLLTDPHPGFLNTTVGRLPEPLRTMHVPVLNALVNRVWDVPESQIRYEASATQAVRQVQEDGGIAALVIPPTQRDLQAAARAGCRLPHKAASFGPKPHPSLVLREPPVSQSEAQR